MFYRAGTADLQTIAGDSQRPEPAEERDGGGPVVADHQDCDQRVDRRRQVHGDGAVHVVVLEPRAAQVEPEEDGHEQEEDGHVDGGGQRRLFFECNYLSIFLIIIYLYFLPRSP